MIYLSEGDLFGEICRLRQEKNPSWFWYRDIMRQSEERGYLKVIAHTEDKPFWWRKFDESIEVTSEKLKNMIANPEMWK